MTATTTLDLDAIKARQKAMWTMGDFGLIARYTEASAIDFVKRAGVKAKMRVLDVACGTGNAAIPAARAGAIVTGVDFAPKLLAQARVRAEREGLQIRFDEGEVENLPYDNGSFDLVLSSFGAMFGLRPTRVAAELKRVCQRGGNIAMANWTPNGFIGQIHQVMAKYAPVPPGVPSPMLWGDENTVRERFREGIADLRMKTIVTQIKYPYSVAGTVELHRLYLGPARMVFEATPEDRRAALVQDLEGLYATRNLARDGTTLIEAEYLEVTARRA